MRNLKKVLAMVLALVMSLSLVTIANATIDFDDVDAIEHKEAVDVMTAIGVIEGFEDGTYDPDGTLTREQAAKMIAYMLLGDKAEALGAMDTGFKDVASTRWSAPYIAYCVSLGIIDGAGDGNFYPAGKLTGYAFAKMLLCALGYGVKDEYVGTNWMLNVARDGVQINLYRNCDVSADPISRDDAAQLGFNALRSDLVSWSELFGTYSAYTMNYGKQELLGTLATNVFKLSTTYKLNDYGFNTRAWKQNNKVVTDYYISDEIIDTITDASLAKGTIYKEYTWENTASVYANGAAQNDLPTGSWKTATDKAIANGETLYLVDSDEDGEIDKLVSVKEYLAKVTKVNAATATADRSVDLEIWNGDAERTPITVSKVETEEFEKDQYILIAPNNGESTNEKQNYKYPLQMKAAESVTGSVSAFYLVTNGNKTTPNANPNGYVTLEGTKYAYNFIFGTKEAKGSDIAEGEDEYSLSKGTYTAYLDSNGYIIGVEEVESAIKDFAYIIDKGEDYFKVENIAKVLLSDGSIKTYNVSSKSDDYAYISSSRANNDTVDSTAGRIFGYTVNSDNEIVLTDFTTTKKYKQVISSEANAKDNYGTAPTTVNIPEGEIVSFTKGYSTIAYATATSTKYAYATDETVFIYINGSDVWTYVGKNNAPSYKYNDANAGTNGTGYDFGEGNDASIVVKTVDNTDYAQFVVIKGTPADSFSSNYVYALTSTYIGYSLDKNGDAVYYFEVIKDGEKTVIAANQTSLTRGNVYKYNYDEALFDGDANYNVEAGVYKLDKTGGNAGYDFVAANVKIDVSSNGNVIVDANTHVNTTHRQDYVINAETNTTVIYTVDGNLTNTSTIKEVSTNTNWAVGDVAKIVYKTENGLRIAKDLYIVKKYDAPTGGGTGTPGLPDTTISGLTINVSVFVGEEATAISKATAALQAQGYSITKVSVTNGGEYNLTASKGGVDGYVFTTNTTKYVLASLQLDATITNNTGIEKVTMTYDGKTITNSGSLLVKAGDTTNMVTVSIYRVGGGSFTGTYKTQSFKSDGTTAISVEKTIASGASPISQTFQNFSENSIIKVWQ